MKRDKKGRFVKGNKPIHAGKIKDNEIICCKYCDRRVIVPLYKTRIYCSKKCSGKDTGFKKGGKSWNKNMSKKELDKHYKSGRKGLFQKGGIAPTKGIKYSEERIKSMSGNNSPNWKGGITPYSKRVRNSTKFRDWRTLIFQRDDFICQKCGIRGLEIHPHHIDGFTKYKDKRFDINNGVTLCKKCHINYHKYYGKIAEEVNFMKFMLEFNER